MDFPSGFYFDLQIEDYKNFIRLNDILKFEMIETVGIELPTVEVLFITSDIKVKNMLLENNIVKILMGNDKTDYDIFEVSILEKDARDHQIGSYSCYFKGFVGDKRFIIDKVQDGVNSSPLEGISKVCDKLLLRYGTKLELQSDIESNSNLESQIMNWFIADESYRHLMLDMWSHLDIRPSFPLIAISRYKTILLKDFDNLINGDIKWNFTQNVNTSQSNNNNLIFINPFAVKNNTEIYNIYAGYGKVVNIYDIEKGSYDIHVHSPSNLLGASQALDMSKAGNRTLNGFKKSSNISTNYHQSYMYNVARLMAISSICGFCDFPNMYNRNLNLLDLVNVYLPNVEQGKTLSGKYIIHTIVYSFSSVLPFLTRVYVSRDCNNHIEDSIVNINNGINISSNDKEKLLKDAKLARTLLSYIRNYINGSFYNEIINYLFSLKSNVLSSFAIYNTTIDLNSQTSALSSIHNLGQNIFYKLLNMYIPTNIQHLFQTQGWGTNINLLNLLNSTIQLYAPPEISGLYQDLLLTIDDINNKLNEIKETLIDASGVNNTMLDNTNSSSSTRVNSMTNAILTNIQELNIPAPVIDLTESEQLLSDNDLKVYISNIVIDSLQTSGYLKGFDTDPNSTLTLSINNFRSILLGNSIIDVETINAINNNIPSILYARYWGSFSDLNNLTDYSIKKGFQDYFRTTNCTKIISALGGVRVYIAMPTVYKNLIFSINNVVTTLESTPIDLLIFDKTNNKIPYTLYYTSDSTLFNSTSVTLKISEG